MWTFEIIQDVGGRHLEFIRIENSAIRSAVPKTPPRTKHEVDRTTGCGDIATSIFFQNGGGRHLGFVRIVNSAVRSAVPENPTLEPNMK